METCSHAPREEVFHVREEPLEQVQFVDLAIYVATAQAKPKTRVIPDVGRGPRRVADQGLRVFHMDRVAGDAHRSCVLQTSGWVGPIMQRADEGGKTLSAVGVEIAFRGTPRTDHRDGGTQLTSVF